MKPAPKTTLLAVLAFALGLVLQAQEPKSRQESTTQPDSTPSMQGMMDECVKHCNSVMQQCDAVISNLRAARDSNDAAKMRSVILPRITIFPARRATNTRP